jgi:prepilin-type N-terminal cleavage/methylation domain-containing protein
MRDASRGGFTLVELLVVIGIIGMVSAIAVPTIFGAVASARNAKTKVEVDMLHTALMNYKNEYGSFPPANMGPTTGGTGPLWLTASTTPSRTPPQVNKSHAAYKHLVKIFPRLNENEFDDQRFIGESPYKYISTLSPAQALVFWLSGFYQNPEYPLTNQGSPGSRQKFFDFDETRLYAAYTYLFDGTPQIFAARGTTAAASMSAYPVYFTGHPSAGLPYVYFDSRCYSTATTDVGYIATNVNGDTSAVFPYINALPPSSGTWGQQHMNADTFQIIAPGKDGLYGPSTGRQVAFPRNTGEAYSLTFGGATITPAYFYADDKNNALGHNDNITNFADRPLADAIEALKAQK